MEFDQKKMIKASRMSLGFAAKMLIAISDLDRNGNPATEAGYYYNWYAGIHLLCNEEGSER